MIISKNNIKEFYLDAAYNFLNPPKPNADKRFDPTTFTSSQLKFYKKEINRELRKRMKIKLLGLWKKYKHPIYAILTLLVAIIGGIIIPILLN